MPREPVHLHLPAGLWPPNWPMGLTFLRLLLLPVFLWALIANADANQPGHASRYLAVSIFAVMAITDKLDGYLARKLNQSTKLGAVLDPVADKILVACSVILLSFDKIASPEYAIPLVVVIAIYGKDVITVIGTFTVLAIVGQIHIHARPLGKLSTFMQLSMVIATLLGPDLSRLGSNFCHGLLLALWWGVSLLSVAACVDYFVQGVLQCKTHWSRKAAELVQGTAAKS